MAGTDLPSCCPCAWCWRLNNKMGLARSQTLARRSVGPGEAVGIAVRFVCSVQRFQGCAPAQEGSAINLEGRVFQPPFLPASMQRTDTSELPGTTAEPSFSSAFTTLASLHPNRLSAQFWWFFPPGLLRRSERLSDVCHLGTLRKCKYPSPRGE